MISVNGKTVHAEGDAEEIAAEAGGALVCAYRAAKDELGEKFALGVMVKMIHSVIKYEKIKTTDILEAIRTVEQFQKEVNDGNFI